MPLDRLRFERLVGMVLAHEGGYVNDPADPGGETKYGISKRSYPHLDIAALTIRQAKDIYYQNWWRRLRCGEIRDDLIAQKLLDTCINIGAVTGVRLLQRALGQLGRAVTIDGIIGPQTISATNEADAAALLDAMRAQQAEHYRRLMALNPRLARFEKGWMKRASA